MSEQKFPGRIWITNPDTDFLRMQNLGPQHEWLHLTEHQHILAEKEKKIWEDALFIARQCLAAGAYRSGPATVAALQCKLKRIENGKSLDSKR